MIKQKQNQSCLYIPAWLIYLSRLRTQWWHNKCTCV